MSDKNISTPLETDWERLDNMTDEDIDYSDIPPLDDKFFANARVYIPPSIVSHPLYDVMDFEIVGDYTLRVMFDDRTEQVINFEPVLYGEMYEPLKDLEFFNRVVLDEESKTLVWPNGADFDPWMLHEWPRLVDRLTIQAKEWELQKG